MALYNNVKMNVSNNSSLTSKNNMIVLGILVLL